MILVLTVFNVGVMAVRVVTEFVFGEIQGFNMFGLFVQSPCDECVVAGQNVFLGPTNHLSCPKYFFESRHLYITHVV